MENQMEYEFSLGEFLILLVIAGICGAAAQALTGFTRGGLLAAVALGFIGAFIGMGLSRWLELPELIPLRVEDVEFPVVWAIIGATLFAVVISFLTRRKPPSPES